MNNRIQKNILCFLFLPLLACDPSLQDRDGERDLDSELARAAGYLDSDRVAQLVNEGADPLGMDGKVSILQRVLERAKAYDNEDKALDVAMLILGRCGNQGCRFDKELKYALDNELCWIASEIARSGAQQDDDALYTKCVAKIAEKSPANGIANFLKSGLSKDAKVVMSFRGMPKAENSLMRIAIETESVELVKALLKLGVEPSQHDPKCRMTDWHVAIAFASPDVIELILPHISRTEVDCFHRNPLHIAYIYGRLAKIKALIVSLGFSQDKEDSLTRTPAYYEDEKEAAEARDAYELDETQKRQAANKTSSKKANTTFVGCEEVLRHEVETAREFIKLLEIETRAELSGTTLCLNLPADEYKKLVRTKSVKYRGDTKSQQIINNISNYFKEADPVKRREENLRKDKEQYETRKNAEEESKKKQKWW